MSFVDAGEQRQGPGRCGILAGSGGELCDALEEGNALDELAQFFDGGVMRCQPFSASRANCNSMARALSLEKAPFTRLVSRELPQLKASNTTFLHISLGRAIKPGLL